ncbi:MAG: glycosyltransferase [Marinobacter sp.]|uniref:O-antigen ligase family protein n=1 Tax=Marinobacter sp. TaxID=50741 RepID=UPI00299D2711|nr:O-antigen ligase family protein [Marinobacter sp.]MDX1634984.1 glycosyltransferase [Marinobacter sp.]
MSDASVSPSPDWRKNLVAALLAAGLAGALLSSSLLAAAALLLAIAGGWLGYRNTLTSAGWEPPKELRLLHFGFWFFVLVSAYGWVVSGFSYEALKPLGTHARLILFWPLVLVFTWAALGARGLFITATLAGLSVPLAVGLDWFSPGMDLDQLLARRAGGSLNAITFGNLALLSGVLSLVACAYFARTAARGLAALALLAAILALAGALLSQTRSNLVALPLLLFLLLPLVGRRLRIPAVIAVVVLVTSLALASDRVQDTLSTLAAGSPDAGIQLRLVIWQFAWELFTANPVTGVGLDGYEVALRAAAGDQVVVGVLDCCTGHAHNDILHILATRGLPGLLSWLFLIGLPLWLFGRYLGTGHCATRHLAVAGTVVAAAYLLFGLTEATFNRSLFITVYLVLVAALASAFFTELTASYYRDRKVKVSATVITMNEADNIGDCLASVRQVADEIIVLDSGSTDDTVEIARRYADVVEVTDWPGFGIQKQRALDRATGDWVLSIDADERITEELAREINHHLADPDADAYKLPWAVTIYGRRLDFGRSGRAPLRLFRREGVSFSDALVHEKILIPSGRKVRTLRGRLTHYTHRDYGHSLEKSAKYAWLGAREKHRRGKKTRTLIYPTLRGLMTFVQVYFLRFGFLDGQVGYLTAVTYAQVTFNKYAGLWTLGRK